MKIWQKIVLGFGIAVLMLGALSFSTYRSTRRFLETAQLVAHSRHVLETQEALRLHLTEAENQVRGYLLVAHPDYLPLYVEARDRSLRDFAELKKLTGDNPEQVQRLVALHPFLIRKVEVFDSAMQARRNGDVGTATILSSGEDKQVTADIRNLLDGFQQNEQGLLKRRTEWTKEIGRSTTFMILLATVSAVLMLGTAAVFILRDVRRRRWAEEALAREHNRLRSVIDALPEHVFVKDLKGRYVLDNLAHRRFIGVSRLSEVEGKRAIDFFPPDIAQQFEAGDAEMLHSKTFILNREEPVLDRDGNFIWLATTKVPLRDVDGTCIGLVGVSSDISFRKLTEEQARQSADQLRRSNHDLQEFASVASHDLQEPLRKIQAFGDRLKMKCGEAVGETGRDYIDRMQSAARRMQTLLHDLLTLSRITSRANPFEEVKLAEIVRDVLGDLEVRIEQTGAKVEIGFLPVIEADPAQMRQLFQNLISNAMKFQKPGAVPEVIVSAKIRELAEQQLPGAAPGDSVCQIMVQDNGIGFDEKYLDRIFTVFQRLHSRSEYEGTGIGLAVCRKIIDRHAGVISAKSAEGEGATFIVTLPVKQRMKTGDEDARQSDNDFNG